MKTTRTILSGIAAAALLTACAHNNNGNVDYSAAGDVTPVDSVSAQRTAIVRVENNSVDEIRVYTDIPGMKEPGYLGKVLKSQTKSLLLDPKLLGDVARTPITLEIHSKDNTMLKRIGPLNLEKGQTVELAVPANVDDTHYRVHLTNP